MLEEFSNGQGQREKFGDLIQVSSPEEREFIKVREYSVSSSGDNKKVGDLATAKATFYLFGDDSYCNINDIEVKDINLRRNFGIGSALMERIEKDAVRFGCKRVILLARALPSDEHPYGFYKKIGYSNPDGLSEVEIEKMVAEDNTAGIRMVKQLNDKYDKSN